MQILVSLRIPYFLPSNTHTLLKLLGETHLDTRTRKPKIDQTRRDNIKAWSTLTLDKQGQNPTDLQKTSRPAVRKEQRDRLVAHSSLGLGVYEMDIQRPEPRQFHLGYELRQGLVQVCLMCSPIVSIAPVVGEALDVLERRAPCPGRFFIRRDLGGEVEQRELLLEALEFGVGDGDFVRRDGGCHGFDFPFGLGGECPDRSRGRGKWRSEGTNLPLYWTMAEGSTRGRLSGGLYRPCQDKRLGSLGFRPAVGRRACDTYCNELFSTSIVCLGCLNNT